MGEGIERRLRKIVSKRLPDSWRIEPGYGSTVGMPDVIVPLGGGRVAFVELKAGTLSRAGLPGAPTAGGRGLARVRFAIRLAQVRTLNEAVCRGVPAFIVVGVDRGECSRLDYHVPPPMHDDPFGDLPVGVFGLSADFLSGRAAGVWNLPASTLLGFGLGHSFGLFETICKAAESTF